MSILGTLVPLERITIPYVFSNYYKIFLCVTFRVTYSNLKLTFDRGSSKDSEFGELLELMNTVEFLLLED